MESKPYGSGYFGEWTEDKYGLPAYRYTCNQLKDHKSKTPVNKELRQPSEHIHQVGNDRITGIASNYGYVQVRQDEGSPKFLNEYNEANHQYSGGFGYLTDGRVTVSTLYQGQDEGFERVFGTGYFEKTVKSNNYAVEQVVFAPFGDDPLLISQVTVANQGSTPADLRWIEYWGCQMHQFSFRSTIYAGMEKNMGKVVSFRREFSKRFKQSVTPLEKSNGLLTTTCFKGWSLSQKSKWNILQIALATVAKKSFNGSIKFPEKDISFEDLTPPQTFLVSLDAPVQGIQTDASAFFGHGGLNSPDGLLKNLTLSSGKPESGAMILERKFHLEPGEAYTLYFAYGYLPAGVLLDTLLKKYQCSYKNLLQESCEGWKKNRIELEVQDEPWIDRELLWHNYYLRSNLTYDSYFKEHILSQGNIYQYILGFQGAARDPLQHAMPFIYSQPWIVKEILRYTLKEVQPAGGIPYSLTGHGMVMPSVFNPSDQELWLLWLAGEYVLAARDKAFLEEKLKTYPDNKGKSQTETVINMLTRCYRHIVEKTGIGEHGLLRLRKGDWNDSVVVEFALDEDHDKVYEHAESVLNGAMASYVFDIYSQMLKYAGKSDMAADAAGLAQKQREAVRAQWNGKWFRRAWITPEAGWAGDDMLWMEPQPWAIIGGAALSDQADMLVHNIDTLIRRRSPIGAFYMSETLKKSRIAPGAGANAGIWPSINGTLIWALALIDPEMAWDEWKKNTLAAHAEVYPDVWYGIWSGPDKMNSILSKYPGMTQFDESLLNDSGVDSTAAFGLNGMNWTDFPVMNMHPHAWQLYSMIKLMGIEFTAEGLLISPTIPKSEYSLKTPLLGIDKSARGYSGWYAPRTEGSWEIEFSLSANEKNRFLMLDVNGSRMNAVPDETGKLKFDGTGSAEKPLKWAITLAQQ